MPDFEFSSSRAFEMMIRSSRKHLDQPVALTHGAWPVINHALRVLISGAVYSWQGLSGSLSISIKVNTRSSCLLTHLQPPSSMSVDRASGNIVQFQQLPFLLMQQLFLTTFKIGYLSCLFLITPVLNALHYQHFTPVSSHVALLSSNQK